MCRVLVPIVAPTAEASCMMTVSLPSAMVSLFTAKEGKFTVVAPAAMVTVPAARVKSVPDPVAVPPLTEYCMLALLAEVVVRIIVIVLAAVASEPLELVAANWIVLVSLSLMV